VVKTGAKFEHYTSKNRRLFNVSQECVPYVFVL